MNIRKTRKLLRIVAQTLLYLVSISSVIVCNLHAAFQASEDEAVKESVRFGFPFTYAERHFFTGESSWVFAGVLPLIGVDVAAIFINLVFLSFLVGLGIWRAKACPLTISVWLSWSTFAAFFFAALPWGAKRSGHLFVELGKEASGYGAYVLAFGNSVSIALFLSGVVAVLIKVYRRCIKKGEEVGCTPLRTTDSEPT